MSEQRKMRADTIISRIRGAWRGAKIGWATTGEVLPRPVKSFYDHVAPDPVTIARNKSMEPQGERLRSELTAWLKANGIVTIFADTDEHFVRVDIAKLPPRIKPVLTVWGSISVVDER